MTAYDPKRTKSGPAYGTAAGECLVARLANSGPTSVCCAFANIRGQNGASPLFIFGVANMRLVAVVASALLFFAVGTTASAAERVVNEAEIASAAGPVSADGWFFRSLFGDHMERAHRIGVLGWAEGSLIASNGDAGKTLRPKGFGQNTLPQSFFSQGEGANLNTLGLMICKGAGCIPSGLFAPDRNVLSRVGPLPGAKGDRVLVDWNATLLWGEDVAFQKTKGFDDWRFDADRREKLALSQWYLDLYLPLLEGTSLLLGSFQTPLENDIGYAFTPPNWFVTKTHAFVHGPAKHVGALAQSKLPLDPDLGLLSLEGGVVSGWNRLGTHNGAPHYLFGARWRGPGGKTAIDLEGIYGNGADDFGDAALVDGIARPLGGGSPYLALSSSGADLDRVALYLVLSHQFSKRLQAAVEATYGHQQGGDIGFIPLGAIPPFVITENSAWYGLNAAIRLMLRPELHFNLRGEWLRDENGAHVLWGSVGAGGGDVYAITAGLSWDVWKSLSLRPEVRYDVYDGAGHLFAPIPGTLPGSSLAARDDQMIAVLNAVKKF
jgi:hypothetical protein